MAVSQKSSEKQEFFEVQLQREISKRKQIEKEFAKEADEIQSKVTILEEQMKLRTIAEEILGKILKKGADGIVLDNECKEMVRKAYGERVYALINFLEKSTGKITRDLERSKKDLDSVLQLVLPSEDKARTLRFIYDGDYESAAVILKNIRNTVAAKLPRNSDLLSPKSTEKSPQRRAATRSNTPVRSISHTPKPSVAIPPPNNDYLIFLQCQASILEDMLS